VADLEERVEQLESELAGLNVDIKALIIELKVLMAREQNPPCGPIRSRK